MAYEGQQSGEIRATLALSQSEALAGTQRTLTLPGRRQVVVAVPAGTRDGQEIRLEGQGQTTAYAGSRGPLILTISIASAGNASHQPYPEQGTDFPTVFVQPPPPPSVSPINYPSVGQVRKVADYPSYPPREQRPSSANQTEPAYAQAPQFNTSSPYSVATQSHPPGAPFSTQPPQGSQQRRGLSKGMAILLIILTLLIIGGSGLILYSAVIQPNQMHAEATSTAMAEVTKTAYVGATRAAISAVTARTEANATASVQAQATTKTFATATAFQAIYTQATSGTPFLDDALSHQDLNLWEVDSKAGGGSCVFTGGSYHASMPQAGFFSSCYMRAIGFSDFAFQVQMNILKGDRGGIIFRSDGSAKYYLLRIDQNGTYSLFLYIDTAGSDASPLLSGTTPLIHSGLNQTNLLTVIAHGNNLYVYINREYVATVNDATYSSGEIAVFAEDHVNPTEVAFSNAQVWKL